MLSDISSHTSKSECVSCVPFWETASTRIFVTYSSTCNMRMNDEIRFMTFFLSNLLEKWVKDSVPLNLSARSVILALVFRTVCLRSRFVEVNHFRHFANKNGEWKRNWKFAHKMRWQQQQHTQKKRFTEIHKENLDEIKLA